MVSFGKVMETARDDLQHMLDAWCCVESHPSPEDNTTTSLIYGLSLEWGARVIVSLSMELEVRRVFPNIRLSIKGTICGGRG